MVQDEIAAWAERLEAVGISRTPEALEATLWEVAEGMVVRHQAMLKPFRPYYRNCGTTQNWPLFVIPQRYPAQLHIDIRHPDGEWTPLYIARSDTADWQRDLLDTERARSMLFTLSWAHYKARYRRFGRFMARRAATEFPDAEAIRLRWLRRKTPTPRAVERGRVDEGTFEGEKVFELAVLR